MLYGFLKQEHELIQEWREGTIREALDVQEKLIDAQVKYLTAHTEKIKKRAATDHDIRRRPGTAS